MRDGIGCQQDEVYSVDIQKKDDHKFQSRNDQIVDCEVPTLLNAAQLASFLEGFHNQDFTGKTATFEKSKTTSD